MDNYELRARVAELLGWRAWKEKRGDYTLCVAISPTDREPWKRHRDGDPKRYEQVSCVEAQRIGFFGQGFPEFERDISAAWQVVQWAAYPVSDDGLAEAFRLWWDREGLYTKTAPDAARTICETVVRLAAEHRQ